jgi:hypothetical protein
MEISPNNNSAPPQVREAIAQASDKTGVDFAFLLATAKRESSLNPKARAKTSSAKGLFQFLDQTWLKTLKRHGAKHGLLNEAAMISTDSNGKAYIGNNDARKRILDLRYDPKVAAVMAAEFASDNARIIKNNTGQNAQAGDLYAAHFLGAKGASDLINSANKTPQTIAATLFPTAASANKTIFYKNGRALSVAELLDNLRATAAQGSSNIGKTEYANYNNDDLGEKFASAIQLANTNATLGLLDNDANVKKSFVQNPLMMAQMYQSADDSKQNQALQMLQSIFENQSLASILSPDKDDNA